MRTSRLLLLPLAAGLAALPLLPSHAEKSPAPQAPPRAVADMTAAARTFLASLDENQRAAAVFPLDHAERQNWKFTPVERKGITLAALRPDQDYLALALLNSALSNEGFAKALTIMCQERILWEKENQSAKRDTEKYHILIFGEPSATGSWGWRFEGHHFSTSVTIAGGRLVSMTPTFMGTNPGEITDGPRKGLRALHEEEDLAIELVKSLTDEQKKDAILPGTAPADVISGEKPKADRLDPAGITSDKLTDTQRQLLWRVIEEYTGRFRPDLAIPVSARLSEAGWEKLTFAWMGGTAPGEGKYYRVQSPDFLFEYDNTQGGANHPHAVWRDFQGDFGADILAAHHRDAHGK